MEDKEKREARRWLSRQLAWEANLERLVTEWEKEQGVRPNSSSRARTKPRRLRQETGLPLEKPAA